MTAVVTGGGGRCASPGLAGVLQCESAGLGWPLNVQTPCAGLPRRLRRGACAGAQCDGQRRTNRGKLSRTCDAAGNRSAWSLIQRNRKSGVRLVGVGPSTARTGKAAFEKAPQLRPIYASLDRAVPFVVSRSSRVFSEWSKDQTRTQSGRKLFNSRCRSRSCYGTVTISVGLDQAGQQRLQRLQGNRWRCGNCQAASRLEAERLERCADFRDDEQRREQGTDRGSQTDHTRKAPHCPVAIVRDTAQQANASKLRVGQDSGGTFCRGKTSPPCSAGAEPPHQTLPLCPVCHPAIFQSLQSMFARK